MAFPSGLLVEFSLDDLNATAPTFIDITSRTISWSSDRGRQPDVDACNPGILTLVLDDVSGDFDPSNTTGPYFGLLQLNRRVRVSISGVYLAYGFVDSYSRSFQPLAYSETTIVCTDRFKLFNRSTFTSSRPAEPCAARMTSLLGSALVSTPNQQVNVDAYATRNLVATPYVKANLLQSMQDVTVSEGGVFFQAGDGRSTWQGSNFRLTNARATTSQATYAFGSSTAAIAAETDFLLSLDDRGYANLVRITDGLGAEYVTQDSVAQGKAGLLEADIGNTLLTTLAAQDRAADLLAKSMAQKSRIDSLTLDALTDAGALTESTTREISDRVTLALGPLGGGAAVSKVFYIEAVAHAVSIQPAQWLTTFTLSPV